MKKTSLIILMVFTIIYSAIAMEQKSKWDFANLQIKRLSPDVFTELPPNIIQTPKQKNYTIPQCYNKNTPHNVLTGEFAKRGQKDWAVLSSRDFGSSIIIFWDGSDKNISEIAIVPDKNFLQGIGNGQIGYSRRIGVVDKDYILNHYKRYGGKKPPQINHDAINDIFIHKGSIVYYYNGVWHKLTGLD